MDYDVVKTSVQNAYKYFGQNDDKFYNAMYDFYKEGNKNPSVAKIIMQDNILKNKLAAKEMLKEAASFSLVSTPALLFPDMIDVQNRTYKLAADTALKSINAEDLYKNTKRLGNGIYDGEPISKQRIEFDKKWQTLYPKTGKIRESIINANRISMDNIKPKAGWYEKINYAKTLAEYKKDYPKTFFTRFTLILNNQIEEDNITPRVKNWFKRFSYKRLIKDGFCFKMGK